MPHDFGSFGYLKSMMHGNILKQNDKKHAIMEFCYELMWEGGGGEVPSAWSTNR